MTSDYWDVHEEEWLEIQLYELEESEEVELPWVA